MYNVSEIDLANYTENFAIELLKLRNIFDDSIVDLKDLLNDAGYEYKNPELKYNNMSECYRFQIDIYSNVHKKDYMFEEVHEE